MSDYPPGRLKTRCEAQCEPELELTTAMAKSEAIAGPCVERTWRAEVAELGGERDADNVVARVQVG